MRSFIVWILALSLFGCKQLEPLPDPENQEPDLHR
jgi:hypothetical protein